MHASTLARRDPSTAGAATARSSATVGAWTLVSRITGLLRVVVIGAVLGPTFLANTFLATNTVPNLTYSVVAGPVLALVVVPALVRASADRGAAAGALLTRRLSALLLLLSVGVALLLVLASPLLAWTFTIGVPTEIGRAEAHRSTVLLLALTAPQVVLYTLAALGAAAQQSRGRFALAAAAPALENVGLVVTVLVVASLHGSLLELGSAPDSVVLLLGAGATGAVALHAAVQVVGASRAGLSLRPAGGLRSDPAVADVMRRLRGSAAVAALPAGAFYLLLAASATVRGGVLVFQMAHAFYSLPSALGARAVTTAVLPGLAGSAGAGDRVGFARSWRQALSYALVVSVPVAVAVVVLAEEVAGLLAHGELDRPPAIAALAACLVVLGIAQVAAGLHEVGRQALFARLDVAGPRRAGAAAFAASTAVAGIALLVPAGTGRLVTICVAVLLSDMAAAAVVLALVRRAVAPEPALRGGTVVALLAGAVAMSPVVTAAVLLTGGTQRPWGDLAVLVPLALLSATLFVLTWFSVARRTGATA